MNFTMSLSHLTGTRKHLASQLAFFDEQHPIFLDTYFQEYGKERQQIDKLLRDYIRQLESILLSDDQAFAESLERIALIGSSVTVKYLDDGDEEEYTLVYPTEADPDRNRISFFSPIGIHLLMASVGEEKVIDSPSSRYPIRIERVRFAYIGEFTRYSA